MRFCAQGHHGYCGGDDPNGDIALLKSRDEGKNVDLLPPTTI
jgi:hypothetical protein